MEGERENTIQLNFSCQNRWIEPNDQTSLSLTFQRSPQITRKLRFRAAEMEISNPVASEK